MIRRIRRPEHKKSHSTWGNIRKPLNMKVRRQFVSILIFLACSAGSAAAQNTDKTIYIDEYQENGKFDKKSLDAKIKDFAKLLSRLPKTARGTLLYEIDIKEHDCWKDVKYT